MAPPPAPVYAPSPVWPQAAPPVRPPPQSWHLQPSPPPSATPLEWPRRSLESSLAAAALRDASSTPLSTAAPHAGVMPLSSHAPQGPMSTPAPAVSTSSSTNNPPAPSARAVERHALEEDLRTNTRALSLSVEGSAEEEAAFLMVARLQRKLQRHDAETEALARPSSFAPSPQIRPAP